LFDVPSVVVNSAIHVLELIGAWSEYFRDDRGPPWYRERVAVLVVLGEMEN
jgi:hypothetical protein